MLFLSLGKAAVVRLPESFSLEELQGCADDYEDDDDNDEDDDDDNDIDDEYNYKDDDPGVGY